MKKRIIGIIMIITMTALTILPYRVNAGMIEYGNPSVSYSEYTEDGRFLYDESKFDIYWHEAQTYKVTPKAAVKYRLLRKISTNEVIGEYTIRTALFTSKAYVDKGNGQKLRYQQIFFAVTMNPKQLKSNADYKGTSQLIKVSTNGHGYYKSQKADLMGDMFMRPVACSTNPISQKMGYSFAASNGASGNNQGGGVNLNSSLGISGEMSFVQDSIELETTLDDDGSTVWIFDYKEPNQSGQRAKYLFSESTQIGIKGWYIPETVMVPYSVPGGISYKSENVKSNYLTNLTVGVTVCFGIAKRTPESTYYNLTYDDKDRVKGYDYVDIGFDSRAQMLYYGNGVYNSKGMKIN